MSRTASVLAAILALSATFAIAQTSGPVAYIYVSTGDDGLNNHVVGYAANAQGELTQIPGSPWADNLTYLATSGSYLFGSTNITADNGKNVFSYRVESNGALKYIGANNIQDTAPENECNSAKYLMLDHTGSYLYVFGDGADFCENGNANGAYQSFAINKSTGLLNYLGVTSAVGYAGFPLTMLADNNYAYANDGDEADQICAYQKASNGNLVAAGSNNCNFAFPVAGQPSGTNGNYGYAAADPTNHLAVSYVYTDADTGAYIGTRIGTVAVNTANGATSTSSTYTNMPETDTPVSSMVMAPGGALLAVGGSGGIQIFNFNPNGQATPNTGLISTADVSAMYWDNSNHLYAISLADNRLHVFTVTATSAEEAPGSPYVVPNPAGLTGHSL